jgi:hypothetical protein
MQLSQIKSFLGGLQTNRQGGLRTKEKLVIIESDDWGAIRTPSKEALRLYEQNGYELSSSVYKYDALESAADLEALFELLTSIKNDSGQHPVFTANAIMANPDFQKIEAFNFEQYYFEPFTETFNNYPAHAQSFTLWKKGLAEKLFKPQFHGREHLNINRWLHALKANDAGTRFSFNLGSTFSGKADYAYMEAFDWNIQAEVEGHKQIIREGLDLFETMMGYRSKSFIAPCYNWDSQIEATLKKSGVEWVQGLRSQLAPTGVFDAYQNIPHQFGIQHGNGLRYNIRNVFFEPVNNPNLDWTNNALARIQAAFLLNRPAVISTHRVNYIGFIDQRNRDNGLKHLGKLLTQIVKKWPQVKFITTDELSNYI